LIKISVNKKTYNKNIDLIGYSDHVNGLRISKKELFYVNFELFSV
jgi:hypothetical protein